MPAAGSFVLEADRGGRLAELAPDIVRPIGSIAKVLTALVVLEAYPLGGDDDGPVVTMTNGDVADYFSALAQNGSTVPVTVGEHLSERDLLLALMLPSANNIAETLGRWVAGTREAFVDRLNRRAAGLGMTHTHADDASGLSPHTVSTALDLLILARAALANRTLAKIAATSGATFPDGTALYNRNRLLISEAGWLGIKTGETVEAGACFLFAARRSPVARSDGITLFGVVLGQPDLNDAFVAAKRAVETAYAGYTDARLAVPQLHGAIRPGRGSDASVRLLEPDSDGIAIRQGTRLRLGLSLSKVPPNPHPGDRLAILEAKIDDRIVVRWPVVLASPSSTASR